MEWWMWAIVIYSIGLTLFVILGVSYVIPYVAMLHMHIEQSMPSEKVAEIIRNRRKADR